MKKYILTIKYDEDTDNIEWIQEEVIVEEDNNLELNNDTIAKLTSEDMQMIMDSKEYGKT